VTTKWQQRPSGLTHTKGMLADMTRITVTMDDQLAQAVKATAGDNVSGWLTKLVRAELLRRAVAAEVACDQQDPDYLVWRTERLSEVEQAHG
jgi:cell division inhibitor SulA